MKPVQNVKQLREDLASVYMELRNHSISIDEAKTAANVSGKIIGNCKTEMEYNKMTGKKNNRIPFLETDD